MRVLVACEYSGRVRDAFIERGHEAVSCDLEPSEQEGPHIQADALAVLEAWEGPLDMLIAFPPCTYLSYAAIDNVIFPTRERLEKSEEALEFAIALLEHPKPVTTVIENPQGRVNADYRRADQIIQPFMFGEPYKKRTCLWMRGLPPLQPSKIVKPNEAWTNKWWNQSGRKGRGKHRAKTFQGVANAMAEQWGELERLPWLSALGF